LEIQLRVLNNRIIIVRDFAFVFPRLLGNPVALKINYNNKNNF
jgi:hypothetical protein